jgi:hypothetical protein
MRALPAAASVVLLAIVLVLPGQAAASHGEPHGPSMTPLLLELGAAALIGAVLLLRHRISRLARSAVAHLRLPARGRSVTPGTG